MKYLLDTHAYLWQVNGSPDLSQVAQNTIADDANIVYLSISSLWEIAIKVSVGKLHLDHTMLDLAITIPAMYSYESLSITPHHLDALSRLPRHHRDPFDRLLVAQALVDDLPLLSSDTMLDAYGIERIW